MATAPVAGRRNRVCKALAASPGDASVLPAIRFGGGGDAMPSLWRAETELRKFPSLDRDTSCDLVVVGSGIAGLSCAYEAARCGANVMVIDRRDITDGMTARTTAHLVSEIDDRYFELIDAVGEADARLYRESQVASINRIETICADEGIEADFARLPGYLIPAEAAHMRELEQEYDACQKLGVEVEWTSKAPYPLIDGTKALKFPDQGRFHPLKYCAGLVRGIEKRGGRIYGGTAYVGHEESGDGVTLQTEGGAHHSRRCCPVCHQLAGQRPGRNSHQANSDADLCDGRHGPR